MSTQRNKRTGRKGLAVLRRKSQLGPPQSNKLTRRTPILIEDVTIVGSTAVVTYDQEVILKGIPDYADSSGTPKHPTAADKTGLGEVTLTYAAAPTAPFIVPFEDPAVRNQAAGYVQPGSYSPPLG